MSEIEQSHLARDVAQQLAIKLKKKYQKDYLLIGTVVSNDKYVIDMRDFSLCEEKCTLFENITGCSPEQASGQFILEVLKHLKEEIPAQLGFNPKFSVGFRRPEKRFGDITHPIWWSYYPSSHENSQDWKMCAISFGNRFSEMEKCSTKEWHLRWMFLFSHKRMMIESYHNSSPMFNEDKIALSCYTNSFLSTSISAEWDELIHGEDRTLDNAYIKISTHYYEDLQYVSLYVKDPFTRVYHNVKKKIKLEEDFNGMTISSPPIAYFCFLSNGKQFHDLNGWIEALREDYSSKERQMIEKIEKELTDRPWYVRLKELLVSILENRKKSE